MVFCNMITSTVSTLSGKVTILILIDGFLQYGYTGLTRAERKQSQSLF